MKKIIALALAVAVMLAVLMLSGCKSAPEDKIDVTITTSDETVTTMVNGNEDDGEYSPNY